MPDQASESGEGLGDDVPEAATPSAEPPYPDTPDTEVVLDEGPASIDVGEVDLIRAERDEYLDHLRRMQAEFDNFRKRMLRDQTVLVERATEGLVEALLPVLDAFEMALSSAATGAGSDPERLRKGVELVYNELTGVLTKSGLERIEAAGKPFDPEEHEAVMHVEADDGETGVCDVVRTGYRLKGRVLRPAMVKVAT